MNINAKHIEELGGLTILEMELNTPDIPEIDEKEVTAYLFDGVGLVQCDGLYVELTYPMLYDSKSDVQVRRTINQERYGNRLPDNFKMTIDDLAICYGEAEIIEHKDYVSTLTTGLFATMGKWAKKADDDPTQLNQKLLAIAGDPCKHFYILKNQKEFLKELDGKVYAIMDSKENVICDVLEEDMVTLEEQGIVSDGYIVSEDSIEYVRSQRVEIIILNKQ